MKNTKQLTVTIGIPAFNEQENISDLIDLLLKQEHKYFILKNIIVNSDGSTDNTVKIVSTLYKSNKLVKVINNRARKGVAVRQNQIIRLTHTDILILINADVIPYDTALIDSLVKPIIQNGADMTSPAVEPMESRTLFEKILYYSVRIKNELFENINNGNNIYTCKGALRCFSRTIYKKLKFERSIDEDAYSYLDCISKKGRYVYLPNVRVLYKLPDTFTDHINQSNRFLNRKTDLMRKFGEKFVNESYAIPKAILIFVIIKYLVKNPFLFSLYIGILVYSKIHTAYRFTPSDLWIISKSSKTLKLI